MIQVNNGGFLEIKDIVNLENCKINVLNGGTLKLSESVNLSNQSTINLFFGSYFCFTSSSYLNLIDSNTSFTLNEGFNFGINPIYNSGLSTGCLTSIDLLTHSGNGLINNGAGVIFDCREIVLDAGFECAAGASFEVKNH